MSSVQELSSGMFVRDFLACSGKELLIKKKKQQQKTNKRTKKPSFSSLSFFQHRLMKKLSDSDPNVIMGGDVSSFMMILC